LEEYYSAVRITNALGSEGKELTAEDLAPAIRHLKAALTYAQRVEDHVLDKVYSKLRKKWRSVYQRGLRKTLYGWENGDPISSIEGQRLTDQFGEWSHRKRDKIRIPK
jgi:hypothetical protein